MQKTIVSSFKRKMNRRLKSLQNTEEIARDVVIRKMSVNDISGALHILASHGLYEAKYSLMTCLQIDSNGFYVAIDVSKGE